jgi:hypothetical protein
MIFSHVLYQLSYLGIGRRRGRGEARALYGLGLDLSSAGLRRLDEDMPQRRRAERSEAGA